MPGSGIFCLTASQELTWPGCELEEQSRCSQGLRHILCRESSGYRNCSRIDRHHLGKRNLYPILASLTVPWDAMCVSSLLTGPSEFKQKTFICPANKPTQKTAPLNSKIKTQSSGVKPDIRAAKSSAAPKKES